MRTSPDVLLLATIIPNVTELHSGQNRLNLRNWDQDRTGLVVVFALGINVEPGADSGGLYAVLKTHGRP